VSASGSLVGTSVGPYRVEELLGEGGMGAVYRARDTRLGRPVALKTIRSDLALRPDARARLEREARAVAQISHPGIATLLDFGESDGQLYLVFELLEGRSLRKLADERRLSVTEVVDMGIRVADALAAAHGRGVIHRDVKPDNLMVTSRLDVKILDFGLAKLDRSASGADSSDDGFQTREGVIVGTPRYMAPEQLEGREVDGRTDLFALGVVLFELLAGQRPFGGSTTAAEVANVLRGRPESVRQHNSAVSEALDAIVLKLLRRDPDQRFASAADLAAELRHERDQIGARSTDDPAAEPEYYLGRATARFLFQVLQGTYLAMYVAALRWGDSLADAFSYLAGGAVATDTAQTVAITVMLLALIGFGVRLYLIGIVAVDHARAGVQYTRAFPLFFVLDELWALTPLALVKDNPPWLALSCIPLLVYAPFSQRTLIRSAYDVERGGRTSTPSVSR